MELRFSRNEEVYRSLYDTVRGLLSRREMIPEAPVGPSAGRRREGVGRPENAVGEGAGRPGGAESRGGPVHTSAGLSSFLGEKELIQIRQAVAKDSPYEPRYPGKKTDFGPGIPGPGQPGDSKDLSGRPQSETKDLSGRPQSETGSQPGSRPVRRGQEPEKRQNRICRKTSGYFRVFCRSEVRRQRAVHTQRPVRRILWSVSRGSRTARRQPAEIQNPEPAGDLRAQNPNPEPSCRLLVSGICPNPAGDLRAQNPNPGPSCRLLVSGVCPNPAGDLRAQNPNPDGRLYRR